MTFATFMFLQNPNGSQGEDRDPLFRESRANIVPTRKLQKYEAYGSLFPWLLALIANVVSGQCYSAIR